MRLRDAIEMLADSGVEALGPTTWADLGCGDGTFTLALAALLAAGSTIHAMDRDGAALRRIPSAHNGVRITTHRGDFTNQTWPFGDLDGILMANALHYVADQAAFIRACERRMTPRCRFLIVEYDTSEASRWLPHPVSQITLTGLFERAGYSIMVLRSRPSVYRRASLYAAVIAPVGTDRIPSMKQECLDRLTALIDRRDAAVWTDVAELILSAGDYRWVGLYEVTETEIGAIVWTGPVEPAFPRFPREQGLNGVAVATQAAVVSQDVANDPRYLTAFANTGSEAIFPVVDAGEVIGTIDVESDRRNAFSQGDEEFLRACATALRPLWASLGRRDRHSR